MTGTNCFGRLSPVIARVIDCKRVPSPPARITAHRSLMLLCSFSLSSPNNHESCHETIPYKRATKRHKRHKRGNSSCDFLCLCGLFAALLQEFGNETSPASLVAGAYAGTIVAMEVFVEGNQIAPVR